MAECKVRAGDVTVVVTDHVVFSEDKAGNLLRGPSNVDYYYSRRGYGCVTARAVATTFYSNFHTEGR